MKEMKKFVVLENKFKNNILSTKVEFMSIKKVILYVHVSIIQLTRTVCRCWSSNSQTPLI